MAFRSLTRGLFQLVSHRRLYSTIEQQKFFNRTSLFGNQSLRAFSSAQANEDAYRDLNRFLEKEVQLEKSAQKHPAQLPKVQGFETQNNGPEVTLTRQTGKEKVTVQFNITNTVNATDSHQQGDSDSTGQPPAKVVGEASQASAQLKSRPTFTIEINRGGQTLAFLCSFLSDDYPDSTLQHPSGESSGEEHQHEEDFQIDEFTIHDGEWKENIYSADCAVIDGELYDKLLNLLEEHGIGEDFANQLIDFSTAYEHRQYIGLLEKLQKFTKK